MGHHDWRVRPKRDVTTTIARWKSAKPKRTSALKKSMFADMPRSAKTSAPASRMSSGASSGRAWHLRSKPEEAGRPSLSGFLAHLRKQGVYPSLTSAICTFVRMSPKVPAIRWIHCRSRAVLGTIWTVPRRARCGNRTRNLPFSKGRSMPVELNAFTRPFGRSPSWNSLSDFQDPFAFAGCLTGA